MDMYHIIFIAKANFHFHISKRRETKSRAGNTVLDTARKYVRLVASQHAQRNSEAETFEISREKVVPSSSQFGEKIRAQVQRFDYTLVFPAEILVH